MILNYTFLVEFKKINAVSPSLADCVLKSNKNTTQRNEKKCWSILDTIVSGSPIIQDGKIVGAVTHVLVNDPTRGYGIFIEDMLNADD